MASFFLLARTVNITRSIGHILLTKKKKKRKRGLTTIEFALDTTQNSTGNTLIDGLRSLALLVAYLLGSPSVQDKPRPIGYIFVCDTSAKYSVCIALTDEKIGTCVCTLSTLIASKGSMLQVYLACKLSYSFSKDLCGVKNEDQRLIVS